jgi:RNA polymerase sigma-70 factor, ECF subfamily
VHTCRLDPTPAVEGLGWALAPGSRSRNETIGRGRGGVPRSQPDSPPGSEAMGRRSRTEEAPAFAALLASARRGSLDALGQLFEWCRPWLLRVAGRELVHDRQAKTTAADCVQDTFLEAQRDFSRFCGEERGEFLNWLRRILLHNLSDQRRRYLTRTRDASLERPLSEVNESLPLIAHDKPPGEQVVAQEQARQLQSALSNLPGTYRTVIRLRSEEGRSFAEIARLMSKPSEDAARKLWERALRSLRNAFPDDAALAP